MVHLGIADSCAQLILYGCWLGCAAEAVVIAACLWSRPLRGTQRLGQRGQNGAGTHVQPAHDETGVFGAAPLLRRVDVGAFDKCATWSCSSYRLRPVARAGSLREQSPSGRARRRLTNSLEKRRSSGRTPRTLIIIGSRGRSTTSRGGSRRSTAGRSPPGASPRSATGSAKFATSCSSTSAIPKKLETRASAASCKR